MKTRHLLAALCALLSFLLALPGLATASPTVVDVRIEGATETLFEGPLAIEPHGVLASSDTNPTPRSCDGVNALDPENVSPAPTPTAAAADAMALVGETFDGKWYPGFDDYFITRFGPDREAGGKSWGILVNDTFTNVGGCQYQLDEGDEVLWIFNAFDGRPHLALFPASETAGGRPLTATATLNQPFGVEVVAFEDSGEDIPSDHPGREGSRRFPNADISPVTTSAQGFEHVDTADPATVVTDAEGKAQITFTTPGWHRIKATVPGLAEEEAIRSNRLDVCVPAAGQSDCGSPPAEDQVRSLPTTGGGEEGAGGGGAGGGDDGAGGGDGGTGSPSGGPSPGAGAGSASGGPNPAAAGSSRPGSTPPRPDPLRVAAPKLDRAKLAQGRLEVSWKVLDAGAGVRRWTISSQTLGRQKARYVKRAGGTGGTSASLRLPPGHAYRLRLTITDALGRTSNVMLGKVVVPGGPRS
jgi:hypothetical protein